MEAELELINELQRHEGHRLGRRRPSGKPALRLRDFLTGIAPEHPVAVEHFSKIKDWGLYQNNVFGICGPTFVGNSRKLTTAYCTGTEVSPSQEDVNDLYRRSGNPGFTGDPNNPGDDNGVDMQTMLEQVVAGGIGGVKAVGFAKVDVGDLQAIDAAIDIFGFLGYGVTLQVAQQQQTSAHLWDYSKSALWGGHAILGGRYAESSDAASERRGLITWAELVDMTDTFEKYQLDEAWVVIWPEMLEHPDFQQGFDIQKFANAYQQITGKKFPADIPPQPAPPPAPTPTPNTPPGGGGVTPFQVGLTDAAVVEHVVTAAQRHRMTTDAWATAHFKHYFQV